MLEPHEQCTCSVRVLSIALTPINSFTAATQLLLFGDKTITMYFYNHQSFASSSHRKHRSYELMIV